MNKKTFLFFEILFWAITFFLIVTQIAILFSVIWLDWLSETLSDNLIATMFIMCFMSVGTTLAALTLGDYRKKA